MSLTATAGGLAILVGALGLAQWVQATLERREAVDFLDRACPRAERAPAAQTRWQKSFVAQGLLHGLERANLPWRPEHALLVLAGATIIVTWFLHAFFRFFVPAAFWWATLVVQIGWRLFLHLRRASSDAAFRAALPGNLRLIANVLRVGRSLPRAIEQAGLEGQAPCAVLWRRIAQEMALGEPLDGSLSRAISRLPLPQLQWIAALMTVLYESGGDLPGALDEAATTIETDEQTRKELWNLTADARAIAFILPGMGVVLLFVMGTVIPNLFVVLLRPIGLLILGLFALVQTAILVLVRYVAQVRL